MYSVILIYNILKIGGLGCVAFTGFVAFMAYSGIASTMRDSEGQFRRKKSFKSILGGILFLSFLLGLLFAANLFYGHSLIAKPSFLNLWLNSFGVFFVIHLYDLIVLDYLVVVKWHPKFLRLPNTAYYTTFKPHLSGFFKGIPFGIVTSILASLLALWFI
jgi:hypothetical protein